MSRLPIEVRNRELIFHVDAGFINRRLSYSWLRSDARRIFEAYLESSGNEVFGTLRNDHRLIEICLAQATGQNVPGIRDSVNQGFFERTAVCGTEWLEPVPDVYDSPRVRARVDFRADTEVNVFLEFSTEHIFSTTQKMVLHQGAYTTFVAIVHSVDPRQKSVTLHPLFLGGPMLGRDENDEPTEGELLWHSSTFYQLFPEDIDEFARMKTVEAGVEWMDAMRKIPEDHVKKSFASILGDATKKDWGGEFDDHYTTLHAGGKRYEAAFLLKGPSDFREIVPAHLGKNADQIYRLSCTPAGLLIVQHSHEIGIAVRATLKAFAYNPAHIRRYCLIDGKDTYRILKAYGHLPT